MKQSERDLLATRLRDVRPADTSRVEVNMWQACVSAVYPLVATGEFGGQIWAKFVADVTKP